ncbi:MAG TPA: GH92 family glycosyl hydrolase [Solirubrobacterales bacterium]|jgi:predicted alpha-1,2-mannosidase|nr:GH92 family glycosyl hydrolase [Solirubrobacterales bacterium]
MGQDITRNFRYILALAAAFWLIAVAGATADPAAKVDVFAGTRPGPHTYGAGHNYPGATVPFGMVQWSPDTTPAVPYGGLYDWRRHHISGFSLTHVSGAGCALYGDLPFVPTTEALSESPAPQPGPGLAGQFEPGFSHQNESGAPGFYSVALHPKRGGPIGVALTATTRTGFGRFTFPASPHASVLIDAGGSAKPDDEAAVNVDPGRQEISGSASSGLFCGQRARYKVYFAARFARPFAASGTWTEGTLEPGSEAASDTEGPPGNPKVTARAGAYATFDTRGDRTVAVRVGVSFVSVAGARAALRAESEGHGFGAIRTTARERWDKALGRVGVSGGSARDVRTFYTALYHALLAPRTFDDVGGDYLGMDGAVHRARGRTQYADFSGWDVYRTEIPLLALIEPRRASDMVQSLIADAEQSGCLPRWPYANGQSMTMVGDSADPMIAAGAAFGADHFDRAAALAAMLRGATEPCQSANGEYVERQGLAGYLAHGYVPFDEDTDVNNANSTYGSPTAVWGSAATTLEYAIDDFAIAQFAAGSGGDASTYQQFIARAANWRNLFDPENGLIEPRYASGEFPDPYKPLEGRGFVEGDSPQYTWMVPQDPAGLFSRMGGLSKAAARLDAFLRVLDGRTGGTRTDHALLGDEPTLETPWLYDWLRRPWKTQAAVRRGLRLYGPTPAGYPGNDDLGTLSAWYVFGALGLYPAQPGTGTLALATPLFERAEVKLAHGKKLTILGGGKPYVTALELDGRPHNRPWASFCELSASATLAFKTSAHATRWAQNGQLPPSYGPATPAPKSSCAP